MIFAIKKGMARKSKEDMFPLMVQWESSSESRESFCELHSISLSTFSYWRGKYLKAQDTADSAGFIRLQPSTLSQLELQYPKGVKICLPEQTSLSVLRSLVHLF